MQQEAIAGVGSLLSSANFRNVCMQKWLKRVLSAIGSNHFSVDRPENYDSR
ncbi:hypothetical protein AM1_4092 [Acaryochloris marina MBIC11017]|uniref:Uncharacterized protein n=1 Tax=Acaryochloris marina (strain MBIC 11017) TaxID=329726 RepID=B0CAK7_ACAM1|nr:hypothetical protein AM1_4092 [Acaryochloris marina MBIC11017]